MLRLWQRDAIAMAAIVLVGGIVTIAFGERIGINNGQGWDGIDYTRWAQNFGSVLHDGVTRYQSQRVAPSAIVHYAMNLAGSRPTVPNVIVGFQVLNMVLLAGAAALWAHLGHAMQWQRTARWVGFVALFGCFANARHALYYPALTDPMAFVLGVVLVWGYLLRRPVAIWLAGLVGVVTWPALPPIAAVLLLLPRRRDESASPAAPAWVRPVAVIAAALGVIVFVEIGLHYHAHPVPNVGDEKFAKWVDRDLLVVTIAGLALFLGFGWSLLLRQPALWNVRAYLSELTWRREAIAAASIAVLYVARYVWMHRIGTRGEGPTGAQFLCEHTLAALRGPLWGPVHQVVYFGPIIVVAALFWRRIAQTLGQWGWGSVVTIAFAIAFAAGSNSRQWNHLVPFLVAATIASMRWSPRAAIVFAVAALAWSKVWLVIGYNTVQTWHEFPNQRFFMNHGPYATTTMYLVHFGAAAVTAALMFLTLRDQRADQISA